LGGSGGIEGMVNNNFIILDEGTPKKIPMVDYNMGKPKYIYDFEMKIHDYKMQCLRAEWNKNNMIVTIPGRGQGFKYPFTQSDYDEACTKYNTLLNDEFMNNWLLEYECNKNSLPKMFWNRKSICDYMGHTPFTPY